MRPHFILIWTRRRCKTIGYFLSCFFSLWRPVPCRKTMPLPGNSTTVTFIPRYTALLPFGDGYKFSSTAHDMRHFRNEKETRPSLCRKDLWDCYWGLTCASPVTIPETIAGAFRSQLPSRFSSGESAANFLPYT